MGAKFFNLLESSIFYTLSKSHLKCCTSTQEPNIIMWSLCGASVCSLYLLEKTESKINRSNIFSKTSKFRSRIISSSSLESELSVDSKDTEINFDRARSTTMKSLLGALRTPALQYFKRRRGRTLCGRAACILGMES